MNRPFGIIDANITTFITAVVLFLVGAGPVRGFAITPGDSASSPRSHRCLRDAADCRDLVRQPPSENLCRVRGKDHGVPSENRSRQDHFDFFAISG